MPWIRSGSLQFPNGLIDLISPQKPEPEFEAMAPVRRKALRLLAKEFQFAGVDFFQQPDAYLAQFVVIGIRLEFTFSHGQISTEWLDFQISQLERQGMIVTGRPQTALQDLARLVDPAHSTQVGGQTQVTEGVRGIALNALAHLGRLPRQALSRARLCALRRLSRTELREGGRV